jgi:hypothetical protein
VPLDAHAELDGLAAVIPQLARLVVKNGVDDNLATLKLILEQGRPHNLAEGGTAEERVNRRSDR